MNKTERISIRQRQIVDCARRVISRKGMENLTIREIAGELGVTDGALYKHFKSKKQIVSLLIEDIEETLLAAVDNAARAPLSPLDKLRNIFAAHLSFAERRKGISFVVINEIIGLKDRSLQRKMFGVINAYLQKLAEVFEQGSRNGQFRSDVSSTISGIAFFGMVQSLVTLWALSGCRYSLSETHVGELFSVYAKGIVAR